MTATIFKNVRFCHEGRLSPSTSLTVDGSGKIIQEDAGKNVDEIDMEDAIIAPGFLELQTNGMKGFHFTHFEDPESYAEKLKDVAEYLPSRGVTAFWATIPTVSSSDFQKILPALSPRHFGGGAALLGAHAEGPYLHPSKKGAHNDSHFHQPNEAPEEIYGSTASSNSTLKLVTLAPELPGSAGLISSLSEKDIRVSLGHSNASFDQGTAAINAGATCLTHTLNAMAPLHHRDPGLAGLISRTPNSPFFSIIPDGNHLHPSVVSMLFYANPAKCIVVTDSIELAGLPDGTHPGHAQVPHRQTKTNGRVVIEGTNTLIGSCAGLDECMQNLMKWSGCGIAEAVRCVTENIAEFMGERDRGKLEAGRKADFVVLDESGEVLQTWISGQKVWEKK